MRFVARRRAGVSSIVGSIFFVLIMVVAIGSLVTMFNSFTSYNQQVNKASNSDLTEADTQLSVSSGQFGAFPPSSTSNFNVATACTATATSPTNREKVFYASDMWWVFYTCNGAFQYSDSFDGVTWSSENTIPNLVTGYTAGPYFDTEVVGSTFYLAIAKEGSADFQMGIGTLNEGGSDSSPDGSITWTYAPTQVATTEITLGPINMGIDSAGNQWVVVAQDNGATGCTTAANCALAVYEHEACGDTAGEGWEPNACTSATAPTNYAPTSMAGIGTNVHTVVEPAISSYSTTGVMVLFESGSATAGTSGWLVLDTQTALASATWTAATLPTTVGTTSCSATLICFSLTSSSGAQIGTSFYFAGLGATTAGATTGNVYFWSLSFSSMTADTASTSTEVETGTAYAWMAALAFDGTTLALFDNPGAGVDSCPAGDVCVQYYTSSNLGSSWSSAILLESAETAVTYLSPADGSLAVIWTNTADNVRFAALSTFTLSNASPFSVHIVDAYVYNPATNALVAHWYYNSTEDFDWWVGQGGTEVIPLRFVWAADTSYLITFSTDTGVTAQITLTTLPGGVTSCPTGEYLYEVSPSDLCSSSSDTNPVLLGGSGTNTCSDAATAAEYMGLDMSYTTSSPTSGDLFVSFSFQVETTAEVAGATSTWQLVYGTGTAPTCEATTSYTGTATTEGQPYTVRLQAAVVKDIGQTVAVTLSGLAPSTTYWFDIEATDSSTTSTWVYSAAHLEVEEVITSNSPTLSTYTSTESCPIASATAGEAGLAATFTTPASGFSGTVYGQLTFNLYESAGASATNTEYIVRYGTGAVPGCHDTTIEGTATGNTYTVVSQVAATGDGIESGQDVGFVISGLSTSTTYWVDVEETDSSGTPTWTYSGPTLAVMMLPTAGTDLLPNAVATTAATLNTNANSCTDATEDAYEQAGFNVRYNIPSSAQGSLIITLTFEITIPATSAATVLWQTSYGAGVAPTCSTPETGATFGQSFTVSSQATAAGGVSQSETLILPGYQANGGTSIWVDVQAYASTATFALADPSIAVVMSPY